NSGDDAIFERFSSGALASFGAQALAEMSAAERRRVGEETGAVVAAVGALSVAKACAEAGVPFLSLRIAFDSREVGSSAARKIAASNQSAARAFGAFLGAVSKKPSAALDLYKVKERALEAADKLAAALVAILAAAPR
ncbi:MAG: hypothetical protein HUK22_00610, partial [Thermoguttaceae bacterium]|nr:hypothetical protein [Thermoguttaceae bacterium]